ncbi:SEC-C motif-containing protein [Haloechinothrix alba]|uniref:SEC-C motif-containing protein n=1 Tax=Haloechinothrix alba TaxID=664784 RepID=A0A238X1I1_9PSEU|nr:SEC-C metal-binding domain-containing protein [Haloechinothrix alba]SNR52707.1 SEC-C motif-containing protein [Haloechinothrix alba]
MTEANLTEYPEPAGSVIEVLAQHGSLADEELIAELAQRGITIEDPGRVVTESADNVPVVPLVDGRWAWLPSLLDGRILTRRLTGNEISHDLLHTNPDLDPLSYLLELPCYQRLTDGSRIIEVLPGINDGVLAERDISWDAIGEYGSFLLPAGTLHAMDVYEGDLVGLRVTPEGLRLESVTEPQETADAADSLGQRLRALLPDDPEQPVEIHGAIWTACADDPELFTQAMAPLGALVGSLGFSCDGEWLAAEGFDFAHWRTETQGRSIARRYDLTDEEALAVQVAVTLHRRCAALLAAASTGSDEEAGAAEPAGASRSGEFAAPIEDDDGEVIRAAAAALAEPAVADAVLREATGMDKSEAAALGLFAETVEPLAPREARPALRWLRAKAFELLDDVEQAERTLESAGTLDPEWPLTLVDLARYAGDRGEATRGINLLRRADMPPDFPLREVLERFQPTQRTDLGRNDPCWCGSGRKYKKCHPDGETPGLEERAAWLYEKAAMFLSDSTWTSQLITAAAERSTYDDSEDALFTAMNDPLVTDAVLFEGGAFSHFLATRGALLPDDEQLLAEQWLLVDRSLFDIEDVRPGECVIVRDLRTGDVHQVREQTASRQLRRGDLVCTRVVPAGETAQFFGGIEPVALHQRDDLLELLDSGPEADELVAFLTSRFAPPALTNTEGDPLVVCEATLRVSDPAALSGTLDATYDRSDGPDDGDGAEWFEHVTAHGMQQVRTFLRLREGELSVSTNSERRLDRVITMLRSLDPDLRVTNESRQPIRDTRQASEYAANHHIGDQSLDHADPEVAATLHEVIRDYERTWLDEPLPALAGLTPRQAADDPTRRDDLLRLLDSFPVDDDNPGAMNPDRLRADLDL